MNRASFSVLFSSIYFLVFLVALPLGWSQLTWSLFLFSPLLLVCLAYSVIRFGHYHGKELEEGEEWGYEDVNK